MKISSNGGDGDVGDGGGGSNGGGDCISGMIGVRYGPEEGGKLTGHYLPLHLLSPL